MCEVTVCIPAYNEENYIRQSIQSVLNQTYTNFKLIILDNCSTDKTKEEIFKFTDKRIQYRVNDENIGGLRNMNKAIEICETEYLLILKADDLITPTMLEETLKVYKQYPELTVVTTDCEYIDIEGKRLGKQFPKIQQDVYYEKYDYLLQNRYVLLSNALIKIKFFQKNNIRFHPENKQFAMDASLWDYIPIKGGTIYFLNRVLYLRRKGGFRGNEESFQTGELGLLGMEFVNEIMKNILDMSIEKSMRDSLEIRYYLKYIGYIKLAMRQNFYKYDKMMEIFNEMSKGLWIKDVDNAQVQALIYMYICNGGIDKKLIKSLNKKQLLSNKYYLIWENILKSDFSMFNNKNNIAIYANGINGKLLVMWLEKKSIKIKKVLDKSINNTEIINGIYHEFPSTENVEELDLIIISHESKYTFIEIYQHLIEIGYRKEIIYWENIE